MHDNFFLLQVCNLLHDHLDPLLELMLIPTLVASLKTREFKWPKDNFGTWTSAWMYYMQQKELRETTVQMSTSCKWDDSICSTIQCRTIKVFKYWGWQNWFQKNFLQENIFFYPATWIILKDASGLVIPYVRFMHNLYPNLVLE